MSPNDCKIAAGFYLADLEGELPATIRVLEAVVESGQDYRPDEKSKTGIEIARHIALEDGWLLKCALGGEMQPPPDQSAVPGLMTGSECATYYRDAMPVLIAKVKAMSAEDLAREIDFFGMMTMPAVSLVGMAIRHSAHHRGQLAAYLRAMGGKVPSIYGPSADVPMEG
jgi:uncharacterized damage-inducible protein DinB